MIVKINLNVRFLLCVCIVNNSLIFQNIFQGESGSNETGQNNNQLNSQVGKHAEQNMHCIS